jgi:arylsulfatase A-like enzyme
MAMPAGRKNFLLVSFDDATAYWPYKHVFGEPLRTPNLDRICAESAAFHAAYCQAPVCGPSRASFMTGRTPHQLGIFDNETYIFDRFHPSAIWSWRLRQAGYFCSSGGKVHHRYEPVPKPVHDVLYSDEPKAFSFAIDRLRDQAAAAHFGGHNHGLGTTDPDDDARYYDAQSADSAIRFLESYDRDAPFYREVGFHSPHGPFTTPARFKEMYNQRHIRRPPEWDEGFDETPVTSALFPHQPRTDRLRWWRCSVRSYFSAMSHGDHHLGRVWDALKASRHARDTVVIVLADHGFHLGNRRMFRKTTLYEQSAAVPLIVHDPDRPEAREVHDPVALLDVGPTVMALAGLPPIKDSRGRSLLPAMAGQGDPDRAVPTLLRDSLSIRRGAYRLIRYPDGGTQLFDVTRDFWQLRDLGPGHPAHAPTLAALLACAGEHGLAIPESRDV